LEALTTRHDAGHDHHVCSSSGMGYVTRRVVYTAERNDQRMQRGHDWDNSCVDRSREMICASLSYSSVYKSKADWLSRLEGMHSFWTSTDVSNLPRPLKIQLTKFGLDANIPTNERLAVNVSQDLHPLKQNSGIS